MVTYLKKNKQINIFENLHTDLVNRLQFPPLKIRSTPVGRSPHIGNQWFKWKLSEVLVCGTISEGPPQVLWRTPCCRRWPQQRTCCETTTRSKRSSASSLAVPRDAVSFHAIFASAAKRHDATKGRHFFVTFKLQVFNFYMFCTEQHW